MFKTYFLLERLRYIFIIFLKDLFMYLESHNYIEEREASICWLSPQMASVGLGRSQAEARSFVWVSKILGPSPAAFSSSLTGRWLAE